MSANSFKPRRRWGCLTRLLVIVLPMGACYWLLLAPLPERGSDQEQETATPALSEGVVVEGEVNPTQQAALEELASESGGQAEVLAQNGQIQYLTVNVKVPNSVAVSAQEKALYFLSQNSQILQLTNPAQTLRYEGRETNPSGNTSVYFAQQYQGLPVHASSIVVLLGADGNVINVSANYAPGLEISVAPSIRSRQAEEIAFQDIQIEGVQLASPTTLEIHAPEVWLEDYPDVDLRVLRRLAWFVRIKTEAESWLYVIDAKNGEIIERMEQSFGVTGTINLEIREFTDNTGEAKVVIREQNGQSEFMDPSAASKKVYENIKNVHQYYLDAFGRNSYNGEGALISIYVDLDCNDTAGWSPAHSRIDICFRWGTFPDVIAHEYTHAVAGSLIGYEISEDQRGLAVHEAIADSFAVFASDENDPTLWQINGLPPNFDPLRDLEDPQANWPRHYSEIYGDRDIIKRLDISLILKPCPEVDNYPDCGHINSIVLSHATYLMSEGGDQGGNIPREKLQYLYYGAMEEDVLTSTANLKQAAEAIHSTCTRNIGNKDFLKNRGIDYVFTADDCRQVQQAFYTVGLMSPPVPDITPLPPILEVPNLSNLFNNLRSELRQVVNELLGDWSPIVLWQPFQKYIDELRRNYWVQLLDCINRSDQACINRYLTDLLRDILNNLIQAVIESCSSIFLIPTTLLLFYRWKRRQT
jgi:Zn-dependent metalloprotease